MPPEEKDCVTDNSGAPQAVAAEPDLPPEYCRYHDDGCDLAPSCLSCPFDRCLYDEPGGRQCFTRKLRDREILRLFAAGNHGVAELAATFAVSRRTVQRVLRRAGRNE
ncbi:MAG: helix-turn-helix domain containing protein [Dehalococcoidales bacterium]|nr:helix-turn-helix domain containing protein [Dehalococcoidales bacterium]